MHRKQGKLVAATIGSASVAVALSALPASATDDHGSGAPSGPSPATANSRAVQAERALSSQLGSSYAGTWITDDNQVVVATTDRSQVDQIRHAGAEPEVVEFSAAQLNSAVSELDSAERPSADAVASWYPDIETNRVVVRALTGRQAAARAFVERSGADQDAVRIETTAQRPRLFADVRGGDAYYIENTARCSVGFSVEGGFVTAGHCGDAGDSTTGHDQTDQGTFEGAEFPGNDYAWVSVNSDWTPTPTVAGENGDITVAGSEEAAEGADVCRSGSTTAWHCGTIEAKNETVNYPQGTVSGLTRTTVCAEPGDSGGPYVTGDQAQGVTSGGSGNCSTGGTTYFQPVDEILDAYGLTLVTG